MNRTHTDAYANMDFRLEWKSPNASHTECYYGRKVNLWRDCFPRPLYEQIMDKPEGAQAKVSFNPGDVVPDYDPRKAFKIKSGQFEKEFPKGTIIEPRSGRFYPKGLLKDITNVFKANIIPFRCAEIRDNDITAEFNHPLAGKDLKVNATVREVWEKVSDTGGGCVDWIETLTDGPGMQVRWNGAPTDFFSDNPFARKDEAPDGQFYVQPRFVNHIDDTAIQNISNLYGELLKPGDSVLDLMSSWTSHLPSGMAFQSVTGLGMNAEELKANPVLNDDVVHDLNVNPLLPFEDNTYDASICTVSVEYLTRPFEVFREVNRVLKPGGVFIVSFSNRWFPPKAVNIWQSLHEFERMGLVSEYFLESGKFTNLGTYSMRGMPRPEGDKYYGQYLFSDPVYCVWGYKS